MFIDCLPTDQDGKKRDQRERRLSEQPNEHEEDIEEKKDRISNSHKGNRPEHLGFDKRGQIA